MAISFGFISTYPPTQCGLATFTASLLHALTSSGVDDARVGRLVETPLPPAAAEVVGDIVTDDPAGSARSISRLNGCDVVIVQHEFGIYGGADGQDVLALLAMLEVPSIVVLHTVLAAPTPRQRQVLEAVADAASAVVVMTVTARDRLIAAYEIDLEKVSIIAHGAPEPPVASARVSPAFRNGQPTVLTWGLLGPGKGIEWGIQAMAQLLDLQPTPRYLIAGQTHPKVFLREGEAYRDSLNQLIQQLSLANSVRLDPRYRNARELSRTGGGSRCRAAALRLSRSGDLGCADRGGGRWQTGGGDGIPARCRIAGRRRRSRRHRIAARPRSPTHCGCCSPAGTSRRPWHMRPRPRHRNCAGQQSPNGTDSFPCG